MVVWHPCKVQPADEMINTECFYEALDLSNTILRISDDEAIVAERIERNRGLILRADQGMLPATAIFITIIDHHIRLSKFPGTFARLGDDNFARERVGHV